MVFSSPSFDNHEQVVFCRNASAGLFAIIAIHDRTLGPAVGGCRMWPYTSDSEALFDVLRLSKAMTYKSAMAGLSLGGGKTVIIADPKRDKTEQLFHALGEFIESIGGRYWGAEDVGVTVADLETASERTSYVAGLDKGVAASGDPSPFTAQGMFYGIKAAVKHRYKTESLDGLKVAVQGLGKVGFDLCQQLSDAGVKLVVADINQEYIKRAQQCFDAEVVSTNEIHAQNVNIFSPCALGGVLNKATIPQLKADIIAGAANNQLAENDDAELLFNKGIVYAPDYVINAGGIINVESEVLGSYDKNRIMQQVAAIYDTLMEIFERSQIDNLPTNIISDNIARERIQKNSSKKSRQRSMSNYAVV